MNPVLEVKRDGCLAAEKEVRDNLLDSYRVSISKTKNFHANLLFTTEYGYLILKDICRLVTFVDPNINNTNWHDLAAKLGYTDIDIKVCINIHLLIVYLKFTYNSPSENFGNVKYTTFRSTL